MLCIALRRKFTTDQWMIRQSSHRRSVVAVRRKELQDNGASLAIGADMLIIAGFCLCCENMWMDTLSIMCNVLLGGLPVASVVLFFCYFYCCASLLLIYLNEYCPLY